MKTMTKSALALLVLVVFSILIVNVSNMLDHEEPHHSRDRQQGLELSELNDSDQHLIWFLQISDIHISIFKDPSRILELREFCELTLDAIKPSVVLASGDLTDSQIKHSFGSRQVEGEWKTYRQILNETKVLEKTAWLDIRGNHDSFNVASLESRENFFANYSIQGKAHPRSYLHQIRKSGELYSFIAVDASLETGPPIPFNFVGILDEPKLDEINRIIEQVEASHSNHTIWFGHFPTSCVLSKGEGLRALIRKLDQSLVYLCGHLHTLGGLTTEMYTLQTDGFLELELGDWKHKRRYRLMAVDHGLVSFVDVQHRDWPVVLVTNPKHALFVIPGKEDLGAVRNSSHIRILAFSLSKITSVKVNIDNSNWVECRHVSGPLYVAEWTPELYKTGLNDIQVSVEDSDGRSKILSQPFALDGTRMSFNLLPRIALMSDARTIFKGMFITLLISTIFPLILFRFSHRLVKVGKMRRPSLGQGCLRSWTRKLWILASVDRLFWPLVLYPVYLSVGPWSIGYIVEKHFGVIFVWGIFVNNTFLPGSFTYVYGFLQLLIFQIPLTLVLAHGADHSFQYHVERSGRAKSRLSRALLNVPFAVIMVIPLLMACFFLVSYGTIAFFLGPLSSWSVVLALVLWYQALHLPKQCTREAASIWYVKPDPTTKSFVDSSPNNSM